MLGIAVQGIDFRSAWKSHLNLAADPRPNQETKTPRPDRSQSPPYPLSYPHHPHVFHQSTLDRLGR